MPPPSFESEQTVGGAGRRARRDPDRAAGRPTLTQAVAPRTGAIRVRGTVTAAGARLVSDTVEALRRGGHRRVVLHLAGAEKIDDDGLAVLHSCRERIAAEGGALHLFGEPDDAPAEP